MNAADPAVPILFMLMAVVDEARSLRREVSELDLPPHDASYFQKALTRIEQQAADFIVFCTSPARDH